MTTQLGVHVKNTQHRAQVSLACNSLHTGIAVASRLQTQQAQGSSSSTSHPRLQPVLHLHMNLKPLTSGGNGELKHSVAAIQHVKPPHNLLLPGGGAGDETGASTGGSRLAGPVEPQPRSAISVHDTRLQKLPGSCLHVCLNHGAQAAHLAALKGGELEQLW